MQEQIQEKIDGFVTMVKENPVRSAAIALGIGLAATAVVVAVRHGFAVEEELETIVEAVETIAEVA